MKDLTGWLRKRVSSAHLGDAGMCAAAIAGRSVHPRVFRWCTLLPKWALLVLHTPAAFETWICLQAHAAALPQSVALIQVSCAYTRHKSSRGYTTHTPNTPCSALFGSGGSQTYLLCCRGCRWQSFRSKPRRDPLADRWCRFPRNYTARKYKQTFKNVIEILLLEQ